MAKIYYSEPDDTECVFDCPHCGSPSVINDGGVVCSNDQCSSNG